MEGKSLNVLNSSVCHFGVCEGNWCWGVAGAGWGEYLKCCSQMDWGNKVSVVTKTHCEDKRHTESSPCCPTPSAGLLLESLPEILIFHLHFPETCCMYEIHWEMVCFERMPLGHLQDGKTEVWEPEKRVFDSQICLRSATCDLENEFAHLKNWGQHSDCDVLEEMTV